MAWTRKRNNRRRPLRRSGARRARVGRVRRGSRVSVKRVVKSMLSREIETKSRQTDADEVAMGYPLGPSWPNNNVIPLGFNPAGLQILQGAGEGQRVGNKIRVKRVRWNFVIRAMPYNSSTNPLPQAQNVRIVLFYSRPAPTATPNPISDFFELNNTTQAIEGTLQDMIAPINEDTYRKLAERSFRIGWQDYFGAGGVGATTTGSNNDYKLTATLKWDITKYLPKMVRYIDNTATATSRGLFACVMVAPADGSTGASGRAPIAMRWWLDAAYTDA